MGKFSGTGHVGGGGLGHAVLSAGCDTKSHVREGEHPVPGIGLIKKHGSCFCFFFDTLNGHCEKGKQERNL